MTSFDAHGVLNILLEDWYDIRFERGQTYISIEAMSLNVLLKGGFILHSTNSSRKSLPGGIATWRSSAPTIFSTLYLIATAAQLMSRVRIIHFMFREYLLGNFVEGLQNNEQAIELEGLAEGSLKFLIYYLEDFNYTVGNKYLLELRDMIENIGDLCSPIHPNHLINNPNNIHQTIHTLYIQVSSMVNRITSDHLLKIPGTSDNNDLCLTPHLESLRIKNHGKNIFALNQPQGYMYSRTDVPFQANSTIGSGMSVSSGMQQQQDQSDDESDEEYNDINTRTPAKSNKNEGSYVVKNKNSTISIASEDEGYGVMGLTSQLLAQQNYDSEDEWDKLNNQTPTNTESPVSLATTSTPSNDYGSEIDAMNRMTLETDYTSATSTPESITSSNYNIYNASSSSSLMKSKKNKNKKNNNNGNNRPPVRISEDILLAQRAMHFLSSDIYQITNLFSFDTLEIARQWTIIDHRFFCRIAVISLVGVNTQGNMYCTWELPRHYGEAESVRHFIERFDGQALWASYTALGLAGIIGEDPAQRASIIERLIELAECLLNLNNFSGCMAILTGLQQSAVRRLQRTWKKVSAESKRKFDNLTVIMAPSNSYNQYKTQLLINFEKLRSKNNFGAFDYLSRFTQGNDMMRSNNISVNNVHDDLEFDGATSIVPHLGIHLAQLLQIMEQNGQYQEENLHLINFRRLRQVTSCSSVLYRAQKLSYSLTPVRLLSSLINNQVSEYVTKNATSKLKDLREESFRLEN